MVSDAPLRLDSDLSSQIVAHLKQGDELRMLDCSRGWAWGYAPDGRVGYVPAEAVGI